MRSREDLDAYLLRLGHPYEEVAEGTWILRDRDSREQLVVRLDAGLVVFRAKVLELEGVKKREALFQTLLTLNANEMLHGAYGISDQAVVITATMRLENLDYAELSAIVDDFTLALTNHFDTLKAFRDAS